MVVRSLDTRLLAGFMRFLADEVVSSRHVEFFLHWVQGLLMYFGPFLQSDPIPYQASLRSLVRAVSVVEKDIQRAVDDNQYMLQFLQTQRDFLMHSVDTQDQAKVSEMDEADPEPEPEPEPEFEAEVEPEPEVLPKKLTKKRRKN